MADNDNNETKDNAQIPGEDLLQSLADQARGSAGERNIDMVLDIPLEVSVELGRNKMPISDLLRLGQGSVVELNKLAGEPLDVLVNGRLVARGEVVVMHDKFGVRLTDIISPRERIEQLGG